MDRSVIGATSMTRDRETGWYERVPKVELHVHLEGAIPHGTLWELMRKYGGDPSVPNLAALGSRFEYRDFPHFIDTWVWKNSFLREYEDFTAIGEAVARDFVRQNIRYAEAFYSPPDFARHGLCTQRLTEAIRAGLSRVPGVEIALVADLVRDFGPDTAATTLAELREVRDLGVIGVGLGGSEQDWPAPLFEDIFEAARQHGFRTTAHAGEAAGAESIWGVIRWLRVDRIGHGTRAEEDESLMDHLVEHRVPLEVCPISNVRTGVVAAIGEHPVRRYFERGIVVTINSDDPWMFGNSLAEEYRLLEEELGFSREEIRSLILQGIRTSWLAEERKRQLVERFREDVCWSEGSQGEA
jgi:adenosine deaminase